jgi:simple sugar transport system ATP-binding protein
MKKGDIHMESKNPKHNDELLRIEGISKWFGKVQALRGIDLVVNKGEAIGLVGDNGAGKSTLIKIISGYHRASSGRIFFEGKETKIRYPKDARALGVETVYQEQALAPDLSIARNVFMGREPSSSLGFMQQKLMDQESMKALRNIGLNLRSSDIPVATLSGGERQGVAIARALHFEAKLVILDEPTIALSVKEVREVLEFVRALKQKGIATIFISHTLHHVFSIADRIVVVAHGQVLADIKTAITTVDDLSALIVRGTLGATDPQKA